MAELTFQIALDCVNFFIQGIYCIGIIIPACCVLCSLFLQNLKKIHKLEYKIIPLTQK